MDQQQPTFDRNVPFIVDLKLARKTVQVSYPTDEQWIERSKKIKTQFVPRAGGTATEFPGSEAANFELFRQIAPADADINEAEASKVIGRIAFSACKDVVPVGDNLRITLHVAGMNCVKLQKVEVTHVLRLPTEKEHREYLRHAQAAVVTKRGGIEEVRSGALAMAAYYDTLAVPVERAGYAPGSETPLPHKLACVAEVVNFINELESDEDPF